MKKRVDIGTDIAMIGAWDASRQDLPVANHKEKDKALDDDVKEGKLFLIYTSGDFGGDADVYIDSEIPEEALKRIDPLEGEFLISVPTGKLMIEGIEYYRSPDSPQDKCVASIVDIPPGDYAIRSYKLKNEDEMPQNQAEVEIEKNLQQGLEQSFGADTVKKYYKFEKWFYRRTGCLLPIISFFILIFVNYKIIRSLISLFSQSTKRHFWFAIVIFSIIFSVIFSLLIFNLYVTIYEKIKKHNDKYRRIGEIVDEARNKKFKVEDPVFVFKLKRIYDRTNIKGGSIKISY